MKAPKMEIKVDLKSQALENKPPQQKLPPPPRREYKQKPKIEPAIPQPLPEQPKNKTEPQTPQEESHKPESPQNQLPVPIPSPFSKQQEQLRNNIKVKSSEEIQSEVKKWKLISETLQKKRQIEFQLFKKKLQFEKEKEMKDNQDKMDAEQQMKREQIKKRLEEINLRKQKRTQQLQNQKRNRKKTMSEQKKQPLYQQKQKQFHLKKLVEQAKIKDNIMKKKQQMMIDIEELKEHQQKFINHLKERFAKKNKKNKDRSKSKSPIKEGEFNTETLEVHESQPSLKNHKSQFNLYIGGDPIQKQKDMQKYLRRKKFEQKVKKIPILIDEQKMKQALIAKDKAKNPLKYNYLSNVAALSDEKIYEEFKDFQININKRELGNDYMRQIHQKIPMSSRVRSQSESRLQPPQKPEYKNYLPEVKSLLKRRPDGSKEKPNDEVEEILYKYESNSDRLHELNRKSDYYKNEVLKKIVQIRTSSPTTAYTDYLGKEKMIDDLYMKSIKMKIATAQIT